MVVGGSLEPVPWGRIGKLARCYLLHVYNFCMYMLNCCRLFFFSVFVQGYIVYFFGIYCIMRSGLFRSRFFFLFHIFIFLLDCAFPSSSEECTVRYPSVSM